MLTSYLRAKADVGGVDGRGGIVGRTERIILFCGGFLFNLVSVMLWLMVILTWITVFQRFWKTWQQLAE
jgi:CDP-diacylglycerol--glycerol-3-phosphate 3-phosphatidyltransferase